MYAYPTKDQFMAEWPNFISIIQGKAALADDLHTLYVVEGFALGQLYPIPDPTGSPMISHHTVPYHIALESRLGANYDWGKLLGLLLPILLQVLQGVGGAAGASGS